MKEQEAEKARLLLKLKALKAELGRMPTKTQFRKVVSAEDFRKIKKLFGSWTSFILAARYKKSDDEAVKAELIRSVKRLAKSLSKTPSMVEFNRASKHDHHTVENHFDDWDSFIEAAGLPPLKESKKAQVLKEYQETKNALGREPRQTEFGKNLKVVCLKTALSYFDGGWKGLVKAASE